MAEACRASLKLLWVSAVLAVTAASALSDLVAVNFATALATARCKCIVEAEHRVSHTSVLRKVPLKL